MVHRLQDKWSKVEGFHAARGCPSNACASQGGNQDLYNCRGSKGGIYKVVFHAVHGTRCGVIYASRGSSAGGNSAFLFVGNYSGEGSSIQAKVSTERHNDDPAFQSLFGTDTVTLTSRGTENGNLVEGTALQLPGVPFRAVLTRVSD